jgi:hypothetical protein
MGVVGGGEVEAKELVREGLRVSLLDELQLLSSEKQVGKAMLIKAACGKERHAPGVCNVVRGVVETTTKTEAELRRAIEP